MAENEVTRVIRVRGVPEGLENLATKLDKVAQAHRAVASSSDASAIATETSAKKQLSAQRAFDALEARTDAASRAYQNFSRELNTVSRAFDTGVFGKGAEGAARFGAEIEAAKQRLQSLGSALAKGSSGLDSLLGIGRAPAVPARESAAVFEAEAARLEGIAHQRAGQIGAEFGRELSERLASGTGKSARDAAAVFSAEMDRLDDIARAKGAQAGQEFQRALNERLVSGRLAGPDFARQLQQQMQDQGAAQEKQAQSIQKLRQQYDPLGVAQERYAAAIAETNALLGAGKIDQAQHVTITTNAKKVLDDTTSAYNGAFVAQGKYASGAGLARHELVNLSRQAQDVFVSLASGQAPLTVLIQQGTQIADVFTTSKGSVGGFFGQLISGAGRFAVSLAGVTTGAIAFGAGIAAAGYRWSESQRSIEVSLMGIGRGSGQTVDSINRIADAAASAGDVSRGASREIATIFAATGQISAGQIDSNLVDTMSRGYGVLTNKSQKDAAQELATALASPTAGAQELEKRLGKLSDAQMEFIRNAEASGNKLDAQQSLLAAINDPLTIASRNVGLFAKAWEAVAKAAGGAADAVGRAVNGPSQADEIARLQSSIERRVARGQNFYGLNAGSSRAVIAREQAELDVLLRARRRDREAAEFGRADAASNNLSRQAGPIARGIATDAARRLEIENHLAVLEKAFGDQSAMKKLGPTAGLVQESIEKLRSTLENFETTNERIARDFQLQSKQIDAYTLSQKAAVESERAYIEAIREKRGELQAGVEAEQARTRVIMEANRQLRDTARDLKDAGGLIGLSPYQRQLQENANASRRERETLTVGGAASGPLTRDQTLDLIMKHESGGRNVHQNIVGPNGGYNPSTGTVTGPSSAQGYFQMTNPTWRDAARMAGVDLKQYPNAMSAPYDVQRQAAGALLDKRGVSPWAPYNANLRSALGGQGVAGANDNDAARNANTMREAYEGWNTPLANANRSLEANVALQKRQAETMFMSSAEITKAAETQRLLNEYNAQGIPITKGLRDAIDGYAQRAGEAAESAKYLAAAQDAWKAVGDVGKDFAGSFLRDLRAGKTAAEAFAGSLERLADKILDLAMSDIGKMFNGSGGTGFFSSMFRMFGGGGGYNFAGTSGGAFSMGAGGYSGAGPFLADGGYVRGPGGPRSDSINAWLSNGEFVVNAASTAKYRPHLEAMNARRYADGGYVTPAHMPAPYVHPPANSNASGAVAVSIINNGKAADVESAREVPNGNGGRRIEVVMKEQVGRALAEPGAASDTLRSSYGAKRRLASR